MSPQRHGQGGAYSRDVVVVGGGGAGLRAALAAAEHGARVTVVSKAPLDSAGVTRFAVAAAAVNPDEQGPDGTTRHADDTWRGGHYLGDRRLALRLANDSWRRLLEWERRSPLRFDRSAAGGILQRDLPGHSDPRSVEIGMHTGAVLFDALRKAIGLRHDIEVVEGVMATDVLIEDGRAGGVEVVEPDGTRNRICARAVVLATGGIHAAYGEHGYPATDLTGDGLAIGLRAGLEVVDMEFVQFFPTALIWPPALSGNPWVGELRYRCGAYLRNRFGERFMLRHDRGHAELATRDAVTRAIALEVVSGRGSPHGGVWMTLGHIPRGILVSCLQEAIPPTGFQWDDLKAAGIDVFDRMEVGPIAHFHMGGLQIDPEGATKLAGLFAAGEVVGGLHGANRIENNALSEAIVFGAIAGLSAARYARQDTRVRGHRGSAIAPQSTPLPRAWITSVVWDALGPLRDSNRLEAALSAIASVRRSAERRDRPPGWAEIENANLLLVLEAMLRSALLRTESRGAHVRLDHPDSDELQWRATASVRLRGDRIQVHRVANRDQRSAISARHYE